MSQAPDNDPAWYHHPTPAPQCSIPGCNHPSHLLTIWAGRRCRHHAPRLDNDVAAHLAATGWADTAAAYRRQYQPPEPD